MNSKENPGFWTEDLFESCFAATRGESPTNPKRSSENAAQDHYGEPQKGTQRRIILDLLRREPGQPVGVDEMMRVAHCAAAHSVISELRHKYGFEIWNQIEHLPDGKKLSSYTLIMEGGNDERE